VYWHNTWQPNVCATVGKVRASYSGRVKRCSKKRAAWLSGVMLTFHLQLVRRLRMSAADFLLGVKWFGRSQLRGAQLGCSALRCTAIQPPPPQPPISPINTHRPHNPQSALLTHTAPPPPSGHEFRINARCV